MIKKVNVSSLDKELSLISEMEICRMINHSRVLHLIGHCLQIGYDIFLVYKFMPKKDVSKFLSGETDKNPHSTPPLDWKMRLKIATQAAEGLCYLHHQCSPPIVHRDIQACSILLDDNFEVRLGSFTGACIEEIHNNPNRISRFLRLQMSSLSLKQKNSGTSSATCADDIFSFGKVLLELITGDATLSAANDSTTEAWMTNILGYIVSDDKTLIRKIVDSYLFPDELILVEVWPVALIAKACLNPNPAKRPSMAKIFKALKDQKVKTETRTRIVFLDGESQFEFDELMSATSERLGKGTVGISYKALLENGLSVAVKRLSRDLEPLSSYEFRKQAGIIAEQEHPNLMPLIGYVYSKDDKLLIYKFASSGNAYKRLHEGKGKLSRIPFSWSSRLLVALSVARALHHLHVNTKSSNVAPYENLKLSNVLLDENGNVLVTDFGLTTLFQTTFDTQRMIAYKSPECQSSKIVTRKSDVWSYGCLLLELLTGRVSANYAPPWTDAVDLCSFVHQAVREGWTDEIFDVEITAQGRANQGMKKLLQIAIECCERFPENRPDMNKVVREVESITAVAESEDEELSSTFFDGCITHQ